MYDEERHQLSEDLVNVKGQVADVTKTDSNPNGTSLFTYADQKHYKSMVEYLGEIADIWDDISEKNQTELLQALFAETRAQAGAAIIKNFDQVRNALKVMEESAGSADREMGVVMETLDYKANKLKETWTGSAKSQLTQENLGNIIEFLNKASERLTSILKLLTNITSVGGHIFGLGGQLGAIGGA